MGFEMGDFGVIIGWFFIVFNFFCFLLIGYDKRRALKGLSRIREKTIFVMALIGGATGVYLGMKTFRHKTKKPVFIWGMPVLLILNFAGFYLFLVKFF